MFEQLRRDRFGRIVCPGRRIFLGLIVLLACGTCSASGAKPAAPPDLRVGAAAVDVTPPEEWLPIAVNGGITARFLDQITDRLHAKAIAFDDGRTAVVLCVVDSCLLDRELLDAAKQRASATTGIPADRMMISSTHTHSAPASQGIHGTDRDDRYRNLMIEKIAAAISAAHENLGPAEVGVGTATCPEWIHCRRWIMKPGTARTTPFTGHSDDLAQMNPGFQNPNMIRQTGKVDPVITFLVARRPDGRPIALFANYSTHYAGSPGISADYFGAFGEEMRQHLNADQEFVGIMSNGTSGDANCIDFTKPARKFTHQTVAKDVAAKVNAALPTLKYRSDLDLAMTQTPIELSIRKPTPLEVEAAKQLLEQEVKDGLPKTMTQSYARETVFLSEMPSQRTLLFQAIRIGDLGIATIPCETFNITGLTLKEQSPLKTTLVVGLANGYDGYLPPPDQHPLGGYTTWRCRSSCLEEGAEPKIVDTLLQGLQKVAKPAATAESK